MPHRCVSARIASGNNTSAEILPRASILLRRSTKRSAKLRVSAASSALATGRRSPARSENGAQARQRPRTVNRSHPAPPPDPVRRKERARAAARRFSDMRGFDKREASEPGFHRGPDAGPAAAEHLDMSPGASVKCGGPGRARSSAGEHTLHASRFGFQDSCGFGDPFDHDLGLESGLNLDSAQRIESTA